VVVFADRTLDLDWMHMTTLLQDLRYALRTLKQSPGFTLAVVLTLALGIGANSALFTLVNAVLLRPLPYPDAERIVSISSTNRHGDMTVADAPSIAYWSEHAHTFEALAAYSPDGANFSSGTEPERLQGGQVTADFFRAIGVHPALGRAFPEEAARPGAERTVILGDALWRRAFAADPAVLGRAVQLDGRDYTVVGIMPPGFDFPERAEFWRPIALPTGGTEVFYYLLTLGRLRPGVALEAAQRELTELRRAAGDALPAVLRGPDVGVRALTLHERLHGDLRPALFVLFATVGCVLLIACANVANLLLARATTRRRELAVRAALGASRGRLMRQLLVESLVLALAGGALGLLVPVYALDLFLALAPTQLAQVPGIAVDRTVLGFALALSLLTGLVFGLAPAFAASRTRLQDALKAGSAAAGGRRGRSRQLLVAAQLALALVLLIGAALFAKSFVTFRAVDPGFRAEGVLKATLSLPRARYPDAAAWSAFHRTLLERMRALPGVESATISAVIPLSGYQMTGPFGPKVEGATDERITIASGNVGAGYFATFGIPLLAGREFNDQDQPGTPPVVVLSESLARLAFPALAAPGDAVGETFTWSDEAYTVVGVVGEVRQRPGAASPLPMAFTSFTQDGTSSYATLALRTRTDPRTLIPALQQVVREIDPEQPLFAVRTLGEELDREVAPRRFNALLLGSFAALALLLAASGLYALIAYLVAQRTREIGIRIALGAERRAVLGLVLREGMLLAAGGIVLGLAGAFALTRLVASMLFRVGTTDPVVFMAVPLVLAAVAALASWVPARRAARVDPMVALRSE
jgi:predicted permease